MIVETAAGIGSGSPHEEYVRAGAKIMSTGPDVFARAEMIAAAHGLAYTPAESVLAG